MVFIASIATRVVLKVWLHHLIADQKFAEGTLVTFWTALAPRSRWVRGWDPNRLRTKWLGRKVPNEMPLCCQRSQGPCSSPYCFPQCYKRLSCTWIGWRSKWECWSRDRFSSWSSHIETSTSAEKRWSLATAWCQCFQIPATAPRWTWTKGMSLRLWSVKWSRRRSQSARV